MGSVLRDALSRRREGPMAGRVHDRCSVGTV
jgi:hypothetical protein